MTEQKVRWIVRAGSAVIRVLASTWRMREHNGTVRLGQNIAAYLAGKDAPKP